MGRDAHERCSPPRSAGRLCCWLIRVSHGAGHTAAVRGAAVAPSGLVAVSCSTDATARLWRLPYAPFLGGPVEESDEAVLQFQGAHGFTCDAGPPPYIWTAAACHNCCSALRSMKPGWSFEQCRSSLLRLGVSGACGYLSIPERHSTPDSWRCRGWSGAHAGASIITGRKVFLRRRGLRWTCGTTTGRSRPPPSPGAPTPCTLFASTR